MNKENPLNKYHTGKFEKQRQDYPGLQSKMTPVPDTGESSYQGANKLTGKKSFCYRRRFWDWSSCRDCIC